MKTYITYKNQIQGFEDVSETVKTTEKIAASSVHFLKIEVAGLNEYAANIKKILARLSLFYQNNNHPLLKKSMAGKRALIVITGDKGLVGGLWHDLINAFLYKAKDYHSIIVLGGKGKNYLEEENIPIAKSFSGFGDILDQTGINGFARYIFDEFGRGSFTKVDILYPQFISLAEQEPAFISFLPFEFTMEKENVEKFLKENLGLPIFEPSKQKVFGQLLQKYIEVYLHKIVFEAKLSELSARTVAMEHASAKTNELIQKLKSSFRREWHRSVTDRQLERFAAHKV